MNTATASIILDKRIQKKDGTYAVKLRITHNRLQQYYPLNIHLTPEDWERTQSKNPRNEARDNKIYFNKIEQKANNILKDLVQFSFANFEKAYDQNEVKNEDVFTLLLNYGNRLAEEKRQSTADTYDWTISSLKAYYTDGKTKKLLLSDITPKFLQSYENWMVENGRSISTVGIYLRNVRAVINEAIGNGLMPKDAYPFGKKKYQIPSSRNVKKALPILNIKDIFNYPTKTVSEEKAKDLWLFTYLCNGINVKDIAKLKNKNIDRGTIIFLRSKTERSTKQDLKPIIVMMMPEIKAILEKWGQNTGNPNDFVFDILDGKETPKVELARIKQATKNINTYMKRIGVELGFDTKVTTYVARHSFATVLKRSGAPIQFISESLGHKDLKTTESYLDSFEHSVKENFQKQLLNFD